MQQFIHVFRALVHRLGLLSHLTLRPQGPPTSHFYNPTELASNLQHLQHLHSVQQQIAVAAAAAAGNPGYWTATTLSNGSQPHQKGRESATGLLTDPAAWRYESSPSSLSVRPFAINGAESSTPLLGSGGKRKRTDSEGEDAERRSSPASFNGKSAVSVQSYKICKRNYSSGLSYRGKIESFLYVVCLPSS